MNQIDNFKTLFFKQERTLGEYISSRTLHRRLEDARSNQVIPTPLSGEGVLTADGDAVSHFAPWSQLSLDLGITPTDKPTAG